jgi:hypothetical protein
MLSAIATLPGCIVPVPITSQPTPADNPPVILWQEASPAFGPIAHQAADMFDLVFPVTDADIDDVLVARMFRNGTSILVLDGIVVPDSDPQQRTVTFPPDKYCLLLNESGGEQVFLFAVVADRPFSDSSTDNTAGLTDSNYWVLTCN